MTSIPDFLTDQTEEAIMQRVLTRIPDDLDKTEGSYIFDAVAPVVSEIAMLAIWVQEVLRRGFASTTFGAYLDAKCDERGLTRNPAVASEVPMRFSGVVGTVIPTGTQVAVPADAVSGSPAIVFITTTAATIDTSGTGYANAIAVAPGKSGNVPANTIVLMVTAVTGVTGVTNLTAASGGLDIESDTSLLSRYYQVVRSPSAGGNKADYVSWALSVVGVGGVSVIPIENGPGTVSVYIIDTSKGPASQELIDATQAYIAPPVKNRSGYDTLTLGTYGSSIDSSVSDALAGKAIKMQYDASGSALVKDTVLYTRLSQPGIWMARPRIKASSLSGSSNVLEIGVWNVTTGDWAKNSPSSSTSAHKYMMGSDLTTTFDTDPTRYALQFYWNGTDYLEFWTNRTPPDTTTILWLDGVDYYSTFSRADGSGRAPIGAMVSVMSGVKVTITLSMGLTVLTGYNVDSVKAAVQAAIASYIQDLAFADNNDVVYTKISSTISSVPGVLDFTGLLVNGGTSNIVVQSKEVAVLGVVTFT